MTLTDTQWVQLLFVSGIVLLVVEVWVLGFATFYLFFIGLATVITAGLLFFEFLPTEVLSTLGSIGLLSAIFAWRLWTPLKNLQNRVEHKPVQHDFIGHRFVLQESLSPNSPGQYRFSGIQWQVHSAQAIEAGTQVEVTAVDVGRLTVKAC